MLPEGVMSNTSSCCKGRGSQEEGTAMPLLGVHGVKDTATGTALVISRNLVSRLFVTCSCRVRADMGGERGGTASFATAHVQI